MKYVRSFFFIGFILSMILLQASAQVNLSQMGFGYSALVRDTSGRIQINKPTRLRFTILIGQNGTTANAPHIEEHNTSTDDFGFVNLTIGQGTRTGGTAPNFGAVDFGVAQYWLVSEVWNSFQNQFEPLSKTALQAVPYAKVAGQLAGGSAIPTGTIVAFGGQKEKVPDGWMLCDGRQLSTADARYTALFSIIGTSWGASGGPGTFNLPNTQGMFLRGVADTSNQDPDKETRIPLTIGGNSRNNVGSYQPDIFLNHNHGGGDHIHNTYNETGAAGGRGSYLTGDRRSSTQWAGSPGMFGSGQIIQNQGGTETRPKNVYVNYIIKL
ncbi:phage tail protein [Phnomibacter sp. MR]|uniref:phage tail protein n=1 Tax=Phnomibacter sp. MR TaxID=3042318 RepID=UPI003A80CEFF